ncbi:MAG: hypothetical protein ACFHWX_19645 [Bacteroidota bacterium]
MSWRSSFYGLIMVGLTSCYCGFLNSNPQVTKSCSPVENTQLKIDEVYSFNERVTPNIQVDTLQDTLKISYFISNIEASLQLTFFQIKDILSLDTTQSFLNVKRPDNFYDIYFIVYGGTGIEVHSFTPNTCCSDPEFDCYEEDYLKMPGSFIISLNGLLQMNNVQRHFLMEIDMQMHQQIGEEC